MQRSLFSAVSGLRNHQLRMDVIGNNIANVNTTAFKADRVTFKESFAQVLTGATRPSTGAGGVNALEVGLGMQLGSIDTVFTQGNLETTGVTTDMAVQGNSFFVVAKGDQQYYTRDGNFQVDGTGKLVSSTNGAMVQGRMATNGVLGSALTNITLPSSQTTPAVATTKASVSGNLDASAGVITAVDPTNPTAAELADPANQASVRNTTLDVYDSLGARHSLTITTWKASATQWDFKIDPSQLNYDNTKATAFGPGHFNFNADGSINAAASSIPDVKFTPVGSGAAVDIKLDVGSGATGLTSFVGGNSAVLREQNGYAAGNLQKISIGRDGTIVGSYTNGTNQILAQVALADFNNPQGLEQAGDNMYAVSANSGNALIGYSGRETSSTVASGELEMSNVDLAQEFTNMIITQRGFQANGKMITTSDQMLQELVNLKQ